MEGVGDGDEPGGLLGAVGVVVSAGASVEGRWPLSGSIRWRYFGARPLIEDGSAQSPATSLVNAEVAWRISRNTRVRLDVFNLLDVRVSDIDYFYTSRLPGEPASGISDIHTHPSPPRTLRVSLAVGM